MTSDEIPWWIPQIESLTMQASLGQNVAVSAVHRDPPWLNLLLYTGLSMYHLIPYK